MFADWELELLEEQPAGVLGTIGASGRPHLVPVCYAFAGTDVVIPHDEKPKRPGPLARSRNIERDPRATLLVQRYSDDWSQLAWVRVEGAAVVVPRGDERPGALAILRKRYPQYRDMALEARPLLVLTPERVRSWRSRP